MNNARWLVRCLAAVRWSVCIGLLLFSLKIIANLAMTGVQKWVVDDIFIAGQYEKTVLLLSVFAVAVIAFNAFHAIAARFLDRGAFRLTRLLTSDFLQALHRKPAAAIRNERTAAFVQHATGDIQSVASVVTGFLPNGLQQAMTVLILGGAIGWADPLLLGAIVLIGIAYIGIGRRFGPLVKSAAKDVQTKRDEFLVEIEEGVSSSREIVAFHRMGWEERKLQRRFAGYFQAVMTQGKVENRQLFASAPVRWAVTFVVLGVGGYSVMQERMSIGTFVVVFQFAVQLLEALQGLFQFFMQYAARMASVERLRGMLEGESVPEGAHEIGGPIRELSLRDVHFRYSPSGPLVLQGLNAELPPGRKIAFVGASGGGKSTIAQLLIRFYEPERGDVLVNGRPLASIDRSAWSDRLRIVFQEPYLFPDTIRTNLLMGRRNVDESMLREACQVAQIRAFIEELPDGYDTFIGERGIQLSGGQRQRLALARALVDRPDILILDEATSALDLETERLVQRGIDEWRRGLTTIFIAHRLSTVQNADLIHVLQGGAIAESGTHEELLAKGGLYAALARKQNEAAS